MINLIKTTLKFKSKQDALMFHLLAISTEEGIKLSLGDIGVAVEIYMNGYNMKTISNCVEKGFFRSYQTVRNSVSKLTKIGVLIKNRDERKVNSRLLPDLKESDFVFSYKTDYDTQNV